MSKHISIVVPVYNANNSLHCCIDSILNQTYSDFELILVDDGSTDESGRICDTYAIKDNRVKVIHQDNSGVSAARNTGIINAKGEYICFIDSDDYIDSTFLESLIQMKNIHLDYDNIWCCFQTLNQYSGEVSQTNCIATGRESVMFDTSQIMTLHENWLDAGPVCKLYSRKIIIENNIRFDTSLSLGEDLLFNFEYLDKTNGRIAVLNKALYSYVQLNEDSLSSKYYSNLFDIYKHLNSRLLFYIDKWGCDEKQQQRYYNACFYSYEKALRNTYHPRSTIRNKLRYNRNILRSIEFSEALSASDCYIHPLYRFAFKHHSYGLVRLLDMMRDKTKVSDK